MTDHFKNLIDGKWVDAHSGKTFDRRNPANGELVAEYTKSDARDVDAAVAAAVEAFKSWRLYPAPKRGELLYKAAQILNQRKEQFAREMTEEMGKVISEARGDVQEAPETAYSHHTTTNHPPGAGGIGASTIEGCSRNAPRAGYFPVNGTAV